MNLEMSFLIILGQTFLGVMILAFLVLLLIVIGGSKK